MDKLFEAIQTAYNESTPLQAAITGLYTGEAPQGAALPYIVVNVIKDNDRHTSGGGFSDVDLQLSIFAATQSEVFTIEPILKGVFNKKTLYYTGTAQHISIFKTGSTGIFRLDDDDCYQRVIEYRAQKQ